MAISGASCSTTSVSPPSSQEDPPAFQVVAGGWAGAGVSVVVLGGGETEQLFEVAGEGWHADLADPASPARPARIASDAGRRPIMSSRFQSDSPSSGSFPADDCKVMNSKLDHVATRSQRLPSQADPFEFRLRSERFSSRQPGTVRHHDGGQQNQAAHNRTDRCATGRASARRLSSTRSGDRQGTAGDGRGRQGTAGGWQGVAGGGSLGEGSGECQSGLLPWVLEAARRLEPLTLSRSELPAIMPAALSIEVEGNGASDRFPSWTATPLAVSVCRRGPSMRVGIGHDTHRLEPGRPLWIGGVEVPSDRGAVGHSDADVLLARGDRCVAGFAWTRGHRPVVSRTPILRTPEPTAAGLSKRPEVS